MNDVAGREVFYYGARGAPLRTDPTIISLTGKGGQTCATQFRGD